MKRPLALVTLLAAFSCGCGVPRVVRSGDLPVYGVDPLTHTVYTGSDERLHYFRVQDGLYGARIAVNRADADIRPAPFPSGQSRKAFVESAKQGEVKLLVLKTGP